METTQLAGELSQDASLAPTITIEEIQQVVELGKVAEEIIETRSSEGCIRGRKMAPQSTMEPKSKVQLPTPIVTIKEIPEDTKIGKFPKDVSEVNRSKGHRRSNKRTHSTL